MRDPFPATADSVVGPAKWKCVTLTLRQLTLRGTLQQLPGQQQNLSLDDVALTEGRCPPQVTCTFDDSVDDPTCGWTNDLGEDDELEWAVLNGDNGTAGAPE